ncbi:alpha/beta fold hydrolase [Hymenobacter psychrotolerans]|uniref:Pimeloyl-ACP methyl ester carboxylesterase n=1 Tax=Hymenobacter psychrotolerans DSM 18569 TaxID=1121959 RepID=A0A1M6P2A5_9BACT|nr:alpha/beta hydrolase [Hymenobacter psychrotolerans]SHK02066.1 Pimeloyl-ACP methyl ester carboxylesterase [Hymenobacter psychrotolerans DSM 18569]
MELQIKAHDDFQYVDEGSGSTLLLLHGLFGALSNWQEVVAEFSRSYRVIIPLLPIYDMPLTQAGVPGLVKYVEGFVRAIGLAEPVTVLGNSLGGHVGLEYTLRNPERVSRLVLTGSSGLFEDSMGGSFPKRGNYAYVQERVAYTFYDPAVATPELVDEVFSITNSNVKCLRIISIARSAQRHNLGKELGRIKVPTLLVWGLNDTITPPLVAHEFHRLIRNSELRFLDHCCHAPMMERPQAFNALLQQFLVHTEGALVS